MLSKLTTAPKLRADFNRVFGDILCLSHSDICVDEHGVVIQLHVGMIATAFDEDLNANGIRDDLIVNGIVEESPDWLQCRGSKWVLRIDAKGIRNESELNSAAEQALGADSPVSAFIRRLRGRVAQAQRYLASAGFENYLLSSP